jgi:NitT/TauT family transport system substrate-binding protein
VHNFFKGSKLLSVLAASTILATTACAPTPTSGSEGAGSQAGNELQEIGLAIPNASFFTSGLPYYVARDKGFYKDNGLDVTMTVTSGGAGSVQAVVSGSADLSVDTGAPAAIAAYAEGGPIRVVGASSTGLDLLWFADANGPTKKLEDLSGKKIGFSSNGSSSQLGVVAINEALAAKGLAPASGVAIGGAADQLTAVKTGQIAAGFTEPPSLMAQVDSGDLAIVADIAKLDNYKDYANVAVRYITANASLVKDKPEVVRSFLKAETQAWDWIFQNHDEAVQIWRKAADLKDSDEVLMTAFNYFKREHLRTTPVDGQDAMLKIAEETGFLKKPLSDDQIVELFGFSNSK